jgi:hypothetical protein
MTFRSIARSKRAGSMIAPLDFSGSDLRGNRLCADDDLVLRRGPERGKLGPSGVLDEVAFPPSARAQSDRRRRAYAPSPLPSSSHHIPISVRQQT